MNNCKNNEVERTQPPAGQRLSGYAKVAVLMLFLLPLSWAFAGGIDLQFAVAADPALTQAMNEASRAMIAGQSSTEWMSSCANIVMQASSQMHWFADALISGVLSCALLGFLLGHWSDDPSWAGLLPVLFIASGMNPACMGDGAFMPHLPVADQFLVLAGQCTALHLMAYRVYERRRGLKRTKKTLSAM